MEKRILARRNRRAVGTAFAKHAHAGFRNCFPGHGPFRRHATFGRKRNDQAVRTDRSALHRSRRVCRTIERAWLAGVFFRSCVFQPTFQKHAGVSCGGVQIHVTYRDKFEPWYAGIAMAKLAHDMYPNEFRWKTPPYEYVFDKNPFDVISGTAKIREAFEQGIELATLVEQCKRRSQSLRIT